MSAADDIANEFATRLGSITITNGFSSDIGLKVMQGRRRLDESHLPCAVIIEGTDVVSGFTYPTAKLKHNYTIEGHAVCDPNNPNVAARQMIADIKKALFTSRVFKYGAEKRACSLQYEGRTISPREDGVAVVAAAVHVSVEFVENLTEP